MTLKIKPCPFCGHQPDPENLLDSLHPTGGFWRDENGFRHYIPRIQAKDGDGKVWSFGCLTSEGGCGASISEDGRMQVLDAWNRRSKETVK